MSWRWGWDKQTVTSKLSQAEGLCSLHLLAVPSCFFLARLSGKQLPLHSEGDTSEISFALCLLVVTLAGTEAPSLGWGPTPHPINRGEWCRADVCPLESSIPAASAHAQGGADPKWSAGMGWPGTLRSHSPCLPFSSLDHVMPEALVLGTLSSLCHLSPWD